MPHYHPAEAAAKAPRPAWATGSDDGDGNDPLRRGVSATDAGSVPQARSVSCAGTRQETSAGTDRRGLATTRLRRAERRWEPYNGKGNDSVKSAANRHDPALLSLRRQSAEIVEVSVMGRLLDGGSRARPRTLSCPGPLAPAGSAAPLFVARGAWRAPEVTGRRGKGTGRRARFGPGIAGWFADLGTGQRGWSRRRRGRRAASAVTGMPVRSGSGTSDGDSVWPMRRSSST